MCVHEISPCGYCNLTGEALVLSKRSTDGIRARLLQQARAELAPQDSATIVTVPSTDDFAAGYERRTGFTSQTLTYTKQVPRVGYPHWDVVRTADLPERHEPRWADWYEKDEYGSPARYVGRRRVA